MFTVTVPRDVTSEKVVEALRQGLRAGYEVQPGMRMRRSPLFGKPRPGGPELILVTGGSMRQAQVTVRPRGGRTELRITPGGVAGDLLLNILGLAREVRKALLEAPTLDTHKPAG